MNNTPKPGLQPLTDSAYAWLAPDGSWGWSNAGLIVDGEESLLVDTLFDLELTDKMLRAMRKAEPRTAKIDTLVNTHANGDHCHGNELVAGARIIASSASAAEMNELPPEAMAAIMAAAATMGKSLNQAVRDYLEQLAGRQQLAAELEAFERSAIQSPGRMNGWRFDREEANRRA